MRRKEVHNNTASKGKKKVVRGETPLGCAKMQGGKGPSSVGKGKEGRSVLFWKIRRERIQKPKIALVSSELGVERGGKSGGGDKRRQRRRTRTSSQNKRSGDCPQRGFKELRVG